MHSPAWGMRDQCIIRGGPWLQGHDNLVRMDLCLQSSQMSEKREENARVIIPQRISQPALVVSGRWPGLISGGRCCLTLLLSYPEPWGHPSGPAFQLLPSGHQAAEMEAGVLDLQTLAWTRFSLLETGSLARGSFSVCLANSESTRDKRVKVSE